MKVSDNELYETLNAINEDWGELNRIICAYPKKIRTLNLTMKIKNASATSEMMADFENQIGGPLPEELKNLLLESNGGTPFHGFVATKEYEGDICQFFDVVYHLDSKKGALSLNYYFDFFQRTYKDENFPEDLICFAGGQGIQWAIGFKGSRKHKIYLLDFDGIQGPIPKVVLMFETLEEFFNHLVPEFIEPI